MARTIAFHVSELPNPSAPRRDRQSTKQRLLNKFADRKVGARGFHNGSFPGEAVAALGSMAGLPQREAGAATVATAEQPMSEEGAAWDSEEERHILSTAVQQLGRSEGFELDGECVCPSCVALALPWGVWSLVGELTWHALLPLWFCLRGTGSWTHLGGDEAESGWGEAGSAVRWSASRKECGWT